MQKNHTYYYIGQTFLNPSLDHQLALLADIEQIFRYRMFFQKDNPSLTQSLYEYQPRTFKRVHTLKAWGNWQ